MIILKTHIVPKDVTDIRIIDYCQVIFPEISTRSSAKKIIKRGEILINNEPAKSGFWVKPGMELKYVDREQNPPKAYNLDLEIIFEDEYLAVIYKPAGIEVSGNKFKTIQNALVYNIMPSSKKDALHWAQPVHRLDYPTSGLLLIAKTSTSLIKLGKQLENKEIQKTYRAIVAGKIPDDGIINTPIVNQNAYSTYNCINRFRSIKTNWISLINVYPHTGRTHQLRIHLSELGFPIVGDKQYGSKPILKGKGLFLSAIGLVFNHPITSEHLQIFTNQPKKFDKFLLIEQQNWDSRIK